MSLVNSSTPLITDLANLLLLNANSDSHNLTKDQILWIETLIKTSPESFTNLVSDIKSITADGKINIQDIPKIIKLISDIYDLKSQIVGLSNPQNVIFFIKFTLDVMLESNLLPLNIIESQIIEYVVDSSLDLLANNLSTITDVEEEIINSSFCQRIHAFFCNIFSQKK